MRGFVIAKFVTVTLIVFCLLGTLCIVILNRNISVVEADRTSEQANKTVSEIIEVKKKLVAINKEISDLQKHKKKLEEGRQITLHAKEITKKGNHIAYYNLLDKTLYYANAKTRTFRAIYTIREPWYLVNYTLSSDGKMAWLMRANSEKPDEHEMRLFLYDAVTGTIKEKKISMLDWPWTTAEPVSLYFSASGEFLLGEFLREDLSFFEVYSTNTFVSVFSSYGKVEEEDFSAIGFVARDSSVLYTWRYNYEPNGMTPLLSSSLYYNDDSYFRLKHFDSEYTFIANGVPYMIGCQDGTERLSVYPLPVSNNPRLSYMYNVRQEHFAGLLPAKVQTPEVSYAVTEEFVVESPEDLLRAIGSNRRIKLKPGSYNLSTVEPIDSPYLEFEPVDNSFEVIIKNVENLIIETVGDQPAEILIRPTYANVLSFKNSNQITISNIRAGHVYEGYCTGGVLKFEDSRDIIIQESLLYGSGTYGLILYNVENLRFENSVITECTYGIMDAMASKNLRFTNSRFVENVELDMVLLSEESEAYFDQCEFSANQTRYDHSVLFAISSGSKAVVKDSRIINNSIDYLAQREEGLTLESTTLKGNAFKSKYRE